jgi:flagellar basal body-associated protein FliL
MGHDGIHYSELKLEGRLTEAERTVKKDHSYYYPELQLEHRRDEILFWVIIMIALFLAACVAGAVFCFFHFFR